MTMSRSIAMSPGTNPSGLLAALVNKLFPSYYIGHFSNYLMTNDV